MPVYTFQCDDCGDADRHFPMAQVPDTADCPGCGRLTTRRVSAGQLLRGRSVAGRLLDATARSAHEPTVVSEPPSAPDPRNRLLRNPLHAKLPRP